MPWVRIDADAPLHPKIIQVGIAGFGFFVAGLAYANHYLTDGFIPMHALVAVFPGITQNRALALAVKLCEAGLWEKQETPPGWTIHDYHHYQPTKESVLAQRDQAHLARVAGGKIRAARAPRMAGRFTSCPPAGDQLPDQLRTSPVPVPVPVRKRRPPLSPTSPPDLSQDMGWGKPGSLMRLYNLLTPPESPAVETPSGHRLTKERDYLTLFPMQDWWEETFRQFHRSKFLRGQVPPRAGNKSSFLPDFDWLLSKGKDDQIENCVKVHDGRYRD